MDMTPPPLPRVHGGPDAQGAPQVDFSTNSNACGPCPHALAAVQAADPTRYPDPAYTRLRADLAHRHGVDVWRVVLAGSASEFIFRITGWVRRAGGSTVHLPAHAYGDYAAAANAWGLRRVDSADVADLVWACEPASPTGQAHAGWPEALARSPLVLDCAYEPLRLDGMPTLQGAQRDAVWQLFSPNKALGLTGVRAAYAIAPMHSADTAAALEALAPSWVLGAHGAAMLETWAQPQTASWLAQSLGTLRNWKAQQCGALQALGWQCMPGDANYVCARPPEGVDAAALCERLRAQGIKLRDATSFGLPGWVRLGVLAPAAQEALVQALNQETAA